MVWFARPTKSVRPGMPVTGSAHCVSQLRSLIDPPIPRCMDAHNHPDFYRQLGKETEQITQDALEILARRFILN